MANPPPKGKFFALCLVFSVFVSSANFVNSSSVLLEDHELESETIPDPHILQLQKLEQLVRNLSAIVDKLESRVLEIPKLSKEKEQHGLENSRLGSSSSSSSSSVVVEKDKIDLRKLDDNDDRRSVKDQVEYKSGFQGKARDNEREKTISVTKYNPIWSERFQFVSAVKLDSDVSCSNVLPYRDYEGLSKYFAVGDERGRVYVFLRNGDVLVEFYSLSQSPITSMLSYMSVYKNESVVITGHKNGVILMHRVWESSNVDEWSSSLSMESVRAFEVPERGEEDGLTISILEVHHVGRMRYVLSTDVGGKIRVYRENGTLYGSVVPTSKPLVFLKQRLLFLTETGAGSLDLRTMKVRESECEGLNHSLARNYVFDAAERSKAYGFTSESDLIQVLLLGDVMNFKCRVRSKRKFEMDEPVAFQAIRGYLLVVNQKKVFVYNVSSQHYVRLGTPRLLFYAGYDEIRSSFLNYQTSDVDEQGKIVVPLIASDRDKLVVLGLGDGYVGMYRSNLPVYKGDSHTMLWTSPVLFFILFLFGAWHFFAKKKEVLTSWGPDDPFSSTSATTGAPLGSGSGDRSFTDSSRSSDIMDLRGGDRRGGSGGGGGDGLRGPSRRYVSPSRYPNGAAGGSSFRPNPADHNSRPASVEPNFRTGSELKYRATTNMESSGFPKRRESLFVNSQVVSDNNN